MTRIFDGMATLLVDVFGAPVLLRPQGGDPITLRAVFREMPVNAADTDGREILVMAPTLEVRRGDALRISRGDQIEPGNGRTYVVLNDHDKGSPGPDGLVIFELELEQWLA